MAMVLPIKKRIPMFLGLLSLAGLSPLSAEELTLSVTPAPKVEPAPFLMGEAKNPQGRTLGLDSQSLLLDGRAWTPVMGEFHYTRYPENEWRTELLKMKAGGIDIVATYVFWSHHEELEGRWNWSGNHDLRRFLELCKEVGLYAAVRLGPWCHGEVRNGGFPEWLVKKGWALRADTPEYLAKARKLYAEISKQTQGLLWKQGGPIVAFQLENEYGGPAEHLLTLKRMAREAGLDAPLYTRTGWPALKTPMPFGEIAPLFGAYAEGFWDRKLTSMPGNYWAAFHFFKVRTDTAIANEQLGERAAKDEEDAGRYPYLTCELGGGMMNSYHRRIRIEPEDIETVALMKIGSGGNLPGYYMYHGGTNPEAIEGTLMETQDSLITNWNDMPVKGYDFFAPLGEYGQVRAHYHSLRRLHLFMHDFGGKLAGMASYLPDQKSKGREDLETLRWAVRSDGSAGFVFISNHQRSTVMPPKKGLQFAVKLGDKVLRFPTQPIDIQSGFRGILPFNLDLGEGLNLRHATAQVLCSVDGPGMRTVFFSALPGVPAEFAFEQTQELQSPQVAIVSAEGQQLLRNINPGHAPFVTLKGKTGLVQLVLLDEADSLRLWKGDYLGKTCVVLSPADSLVFDQGHLSASASDPARLSLGFCPTQKGENIGPGPKRWSGVFQFADQPVAPQPTMKAVVSKLRAAGPARQVQMGKSKQPVAAAPTDADFEHAAVWRIQVPDSALAHPECFLRLHYQGDAIRVMIGDTFITDDYSNGRPLDIGLWRHRVALAKEELKVLILPLRSDAPIFIPDDARPKEGSVAALDSAELIPMSSVLREAQVLPRP